MNPRSKPARILAVDDDPRVLHATKRILKGQYELATTSCPLEALTLAAGFCPDLALLDIRMPAMDGFELMQRLRAEQPDMDIIFVTGSMTDPDAHLIRAIQQGAFYFIQSRTTGKSCKLLSSAALSYADCAHRPTMNSSSYAWPRAGSCRKSRP